jgi:hypothetical protein
MNYLPERHEWLEPEGSVYDAYEYEETWQELPIPPAIQKGIWDRKILETTEAIRRLTEELQSNKMRLNYYKKERQDMDVLENVRPLVYHI